MEHNFLFIDTETTGFPKSGERIQEGQARVCQIAMILSAPNGRTLAEFSTLVKPYKWTIHPKAQAIHGISDDMCAKYGLPQKQVMDIYYQLASKAGQKIAHNEKFDRQMMDIENAYYCDEDLGAEAQWYCTMITNTTYGGKWPKLADLYRQKCGKELVNAHDAMADTRACRDIFFAGRGIIIK